MIVNIDKLEFGYPKWNDSEKRESEFYKHKKKGYNGWFYQRVLVSMKKRGMLNPIMVVPSDKEQFDYKVILGHNRVLAALELGWTTIEAVVKPETLKPVEFKKLVYQCTDID